MASCQALEQHESRVAAQLFRHELNNRYVYINAECIAVTKWTVYCCQFIIISMTQGRLDILGTITPAMETSSSTSGKGPLQSIP